MYPLKALNLAHKSVNIYHFKVKFSRRQINDMFNISQKIGFDISWNLSAVETVCIECQILFSGKNKKTISKCRLLNIPPSILSLNKYI